MNSGAIWDNMDADLKAALEAVKVKVPQDSYSPTIIDWEGKLFLPREHDLFSTREYSFQAEWDLITQDQYYQENNTDSARKKYKKNSSSSDDYWGMSPVANNGGRVFYVTPEGSATGYYSTYPFGVSLRFAL